MKMTKLQFWVGLLALTALNLVIAEAVVPDDNMMATIGFFAWCLLSGALYGLSVKVEG